MGEWGRDALSEMRSRTKDCTELPCGTDEACFLLAVEGVEGRRRKVEVREEGRVHVHGLWSWHRTADEVEEDLGVRDYV